MWSRGQWVGEESGCARADKKRAVGVSGNPINGREWVERNVDLANWDGGRVEGNPAGDSARKGVICVEKV